MIPFLLVSARHLLQAGLDGTVRTAVLLATYLKHTSTLLLLLYSSTSIMSSVSGVRGV